MTKKIRFPLELADGTQARTLEDLQEHFDLESVLGYYKSGKLLTWLKDRYLESEADAIHVLDESDPTFLERFCNIFGVEYTDDSVDLEEIAHRQERLAKLRTYTDEVEFIDHIDFVAFNQEELADLLDDGQKEIYLCGNRFDIPVSQCGVHYKGIANPTVHLSGTLPADIRAMGITFKNCNVDNFPESEFVMKEEVAIVDTYENTDETENSPEDITPDSRGYLPITSKEELRKAAEEEPLSIFLRPIKCDSYAVIDIMLYGYHGYLTAAVDKDREIIKAYDIRFPRKPEIRLDDLTEEELDAVMTPWVTPGVFKDSKFSMNRLATLGEAREWMIESFKSTRNLIIHSSEFCGSTELDPPAKSKWRKVNPYPRCTDKYKEWEERNKD